MGSISFYRVGDYGYDELIGYWFDKKGQRHMTTNTVWRSTLTDPPTERDYPVQAGHWYIDGSRFGTAHYAEPHPAITGMHRYWRSIKCDPPPREMTQRERDTEAWSAWISAGGPKGLEAVWRGALTWERAEVVKDLIEAYGAFHHAALDTRTSAGFFRDFFRARREGGSK